MSGYKRAHFAGRAISNYQPSAPLYWFHPAIREGHFSWRDIPSMLRNPTVQIGLAVLKAPIASAQWKINTKSKEVQQYVDKTLNRFWQHQLSNVLDRYYAWGTCCAENFFADDNGVIKWSHLEEFWFFDTQARHRGSEVIGLRVGGGWVRSPKMFWVAHDPVLGNPYGRSRLLGAWGAWMERDGAKGAKDARRLWYFKYAFRGGVMWYPPGSEYKDETSGTSKDNQDIAREIVEKSESGAVYAMPMEYDSEGRKMWDFEPAQLNGTGSGDLREYPKDLDNEILKGMRILPEVVEAAEVGGGWSGRSVPLLMQLSMADQDVRVIIQAVDRCIIRPSVLANFGPGARYEIEPIPFVPRGRPDPNQGQIPAHLRQQYERNERGHFAPKGAGVPAEQRQGMMPASGNPQQMMQGVQMSQADEGEDAFMPIDDDGWYEPEPIALSSGVHAPQGGVTIRGTFYKGGEFIPSEVIEQASPQERRDIFYSGRNLKPQAKPQEQPDPNRAPWSMSPQELKAAGVSFYRTGQGSLYAHHPKTGQTIRVKAPHVGHETKDVGLKRGSEQTVYVDPEHARQIGMWQTGNWSDRRLILHEGHVHLASRNPKTGQHGRDYKPIPFHSAPKMGMSPLELNDRRNEAGLQQHFSGSTIYSGSHPGSPISEMNVPHEEGHKHLVSAARAAGKKGVYGDKPASLSSASDEGRWITIGAATGEDGKKHGGSPVFIKGGRIVKGHPSLTGRKIDALKEEPEYAERKHSDNAKKERALRAAETRGINKEGGEYARAVATKQAKKEGIDPASLHQLAGEILAHDQAFKSELTGVMQTAREQLRKLYGTDVTALKTNAARGTIDASHVRGLDDVAAGLAKQYPHIFPSGQSSEERLFDLLVSGNPEAMAEEHAYDEALEQLRDMKPQEPEESEASDAGVTDVGDFNPDEFDEPTPEPEPQRPTISHDDIKSAKRMLGSGTLKVNQGEATSDLSGHPIRHHVTLPSGARVHPDELHRAVLDEGKVALNPHEGLHVKDPLGEGQHGSFARALNAVGAFKGRDEDRVTIQTPHGYNVTRTRGEWRELEHSGEPFHVWYDRESPAAVSEAAAKSEQPSATIASERDTANFFAPQTDQGSLFNVRTKPLESSNATREGQQPESREPEHPHRDEGGQAAKAGHRDRDEESRQEPQEVTEAPPPPSRESSPTPAAESGISIVGRGTGTTPVEEHIATVQALFDQAPDDAALDETLNGVGNDLTRDGAKDLARALGMKGKWKNRQELMEDVRGRIVAKRQPRFGAGTPLESIHEKRLKHFASKLSQADTELRERISTAASETEKPSEAQKEAGNYKKGKVTIAGLPITIENALGSERSGKSKDGVEWSVTMPAHYGYIRRTESEADGDHVDVFIGPDPESEIVFVIDQLTPGGRFDEHKCMLGYVNATDAKEGYLAAYSEGWTGFGSITPMTLEKFKDWIEHGDTSKPLAKQAASLSQAVGRDEAIAAARLLVQAYVGS